MLLHILHTSLSTRPISRHAHRPSPHHPPHRTSDGRRGIYAMTPTATCSTWRDIRTMPTCLRPHWISATTVQRGRVTPTIPTEISSAIRYFEIRYNLLNLASEVIGLDPEESADSATASAGDGTTRYIGSLIYEGEPGQETFEGVSTDYGDITPHWLNCLFKNRSGVLFYCC